MVLHPRPHGAPRPAACPRAPCRPHLLRYSRPHGRCVVSAAVPRDGSGEAEALGEAVDLFKAASTLARLQTQHELQQAFVADLERTADTSVQPTSRRALVSFWTEQGLTAKSSEELVQRLEQAGQQYSLEQLVAKVQRLQRILPDAQVAQLVERDPQLLQADPSQAVRNLVLLVTTFPGRDLTSLIERAPRLLYMEDLPERQERVIGHLVRLHPSKDRAVVGGVMYEQPALYWRMDYYKHARMLDELPIEIQNWFVVNGRGIGFLHQYYRMKRREAGAMTDTTDDERE